MVVLIRSISQCWGDGSHYKLWDSYQNQQDLELEALTWTDRHLQTSASPYHICTYKVRLHNAASILSRKKHKLAFCKSEFSDSKLLFRKQTLFFAWWLFCTSVIFFSKAEQLLLEQNC